MALAVGCTWAQRLASGFLRKQRSTTITPCANSFWEPDRKGGYKTKEEDRRPLKKKFKESVKLLGGEIALWKDEWKTNINVDNQMLFGLEPGDHEIMWKFDSNESVNNWITTKDKDHNEGYSNAEFFLGKNKTGIFQGYINTEVPKDGIIKRSGYANVKSPRYRKSFKREASYDWTNYTHLIMRVRGDGRTYALTVGVDRYFDVQWNDQYNYALYTRGGPYWQTAKIPLSKFFLSSRGRIQDKQESLMDQLDKITNLGITLGDGNMGPFQLEIDYIGVMYDAEHKEHFAYEMYKVSHL